MSPSSAAPVVAGPGRPLLRAAERALGGRRSVRAARRVVRDVWRLWLDSGDRVVAKRHPAADGLAVPAADPLVVEAEVLARLAVAGAAVPQFLGADAAERVAVFSDVGTWTLDDWLQARPGADPHLWAARAVDAVGGVEQALAGATASLQRWVPAWAQKSALTRAWAAAIRQAQTGLAWLVPPPGREAAACLAELADDLARRSPTLGSADYNPGNVVVDPVAGTVCLIEFSALGWDWPERRLVQYTTSLGARRPDGQLTPLLNVAAVDQAATLGFDAVAIDGHWLVFLLNLAAVLAQVERAAVTGPTRLWAGTERRRQLQAALSVPLAASGPAAACRRCIHQISFVEGEETR